jgi:hypothetical protein
MLVLGRSSVAVTASREARARRLMNGAYLPARGEVDFTCLAARQEGPLAPLKQECAAFPRQRAFIEFMEERPRIV